MGAGSVLDYGAPTTDHLTKVMLEDEKVGEVNRVIYSLLKERGIYAQINFESIIHFIDSLINYLRSDYKSGFRDIYNSFTKLDIEELEEKLVKLDNIEDQRDVVKLSDKLYLRAVKLLFYNYYSLLIPELRVYCEINKAEGVLEVLKEWYLNEVNRSILRTYTTNYDRLIPRLLESEINIFDGFNPTEKHLSSKPNVSGIFRSSEEPNYFNLHGSLFWNISFASKTRYWKRDAKDLIGANSYPKEFNTSEPNSANFLLPIITGYAKVRKTQISPLREFFYALEKDVIEANKLIIAGYSFSDDHINSIIDSAVYYNPNIEYEIVDFSVDGSEKLIKEKISNTLHNSKPSKMNFYMQGFSDYLVKQCK